MSKKKEEIVAAPKPQGEFGYRTLAAMIMPYVKICKPTTNVDEFLALFHVTPKIVNENFTIHATEITQNEGYRWRMNFLISKHNADKMHMIVEYKSKDDAAMFILSYLEGHTRFKGVTTNEETVNAQEIAAHMVIADEWIKPEVHNEFDVAF